MLQVYRVIAPFQAQQLDTEKVHLEDFARGDLLIALREEASSIVFCRRHDPLDLSECDRFIASGLEFETCTEPYASSRRP